MNPNLNPERQLHIETKPEARWTAVHTKPRCEKIVDEYCLRHDLTAYLPLQRTAKRYQRRTVVHYLPMFRGYLFVQLAPEQQTTLLQSHKVVHILPITEAGEARLVEELRQLQIMEQGAEEVDVVVQPTIIEGRPVEIRRGPMKGLHGVVEKRRSRIRVAHRRRQ